MHSRIANLLARRRVFAVMLATALGASGVVTTNAMSAGGAGLPDSLLNSNSGKCLDIYQNSKSDGAIADQWTCNGGSNQTWTFTQVGAGQNYTLENNNGKCLDVYQKSLSVGATVDQWTCTGGLNQLWTAANINGTATWVNVNSNLCLDVYHASLSDGAKVDQWTCNGGSNQNWYLGPR